MNTLYYMYSTQSSTQVLHRQVRTPVTLSERQDFEISMS